MRGRQLAGRLWALLIVATVLVSVQSVRPAVAKSHKAAVCHFQTDKGTWKRLAVAKSALKNHLKNHDDAVPGDATTMTGTVLDAACAVVPPLQR